MASSGFHTTIKRALVMHLATWSKAEAATGKADKANPVSCFEMACVLCFVFLVEMVLTVIADSSIPAVPHEQDHDGLQPLFEVHRRPAAGACRPPPLTLGSQGPHSRLLVSACASSAVVSACLASASADAWYRISIVIAQLLPVFR